jgi:hypothetical protein
MKAKKAIKRLQHIETLLGAVIDGYDAGTSGVNDLLNTARSSVASASQTLAAAPATKVPARADSARKRLPVAAKKRGAAANHAKPSHKTPAAHSAEVAP